MLSGAVYLTTSYQFLSALTTVYNFTEPPPKHDVTGFMISAYV